MPARESVIRRLSGSTREIVLKPLKRAYQPVVLTSQTEGGVARSPSSWRFARERCKRPQPENVVWAMSDNGN